MYNSYTPTTEIKRFATKRMFPPGIIVANIKATRTIPLNNLVKKDLFANLLKTIFVFLLPLWYTQANIKITNLGKEKRS